MLERPGIEPAIAKKHASLAHHERPDTSTGKHFWPVLQCSK